MEKDARLGRGNWRGCHRFSDIICDGESVLPLEAKREGGLLEGGRYWYYVSRAYGAVYKVLTDITQYRLDDEVEIHDGAHPSTTDCPFLPGQQVNLLEVPIQGKHLLRDYHNRSPSSDMSGALTLDPADKFLTPRPPSPNTRRRLSNACERPVTRSSSRPRTAVGDNEAPRQWPDATWLEDETRPSTPLGASSIYSEPPIPVAAWHSLKHSRPQSTGGLGFGDYPSLSFNDSLADLGGGHSWLDLSEVEDFDAVEWATVPLADQPIIVSENPQAGNLVLGQPDPLRAHAIERTEELDIQPASPPKRMPSNASHRISQPTSHRPSSIVAEDFPLRPLRDSTAESDSFSMQTSPLRAASDAPSQRGETSLTRSGSVACSLQHTISVSSARTSGMFSSLTSGSGTRDTTRHSRLSQPLTPTISEAGNIVVDRSFDQSPLQLQSTPARRLDSGFLGYSLPEAELSALTIRNLETANSCNSPDLSTYTSSHRKQYVEAWNDGHEDRSTTFQELVDDLGYLGSMIA